MNISKEKNRIYHHYEMWEDWKNGFYNNCSGEERIIKKQSVLKMFNSEKLTLENMYRVINEWKFSCEHNLTNNSLNKIAYIGQAACCIYDKVPCDVTMECWSELTNEVQERANKNALEVLNKWIQNNKNIQLCLNIF
jgi:hypothetical protein